MHRAACSFAVGALSLCTVKTRRSCSVSRKMRSAPSLIIRHRCLRQVPASDVWTLPIDLCRRSDAPGLHLANYNFQTSRFLTNLSSHIWQHVMHLSRAVARISFYRGEANFGPKSEVRRPRAGVELLGEGTASPFPTSYGIWGSSVSSPGGVWGGAPASKRFSRVSSVQSGPSRQFSVAYCCL